jgi:exopolyphosphatase/guanosine-5'-triphosphate,3'-diphosphate pyrophosphatase
VEQRLAVIDLGSNSFRLVVFSHTPEWWKRTDEIYEPVRVGEGQEEGGPLRAGPMERALETIDLFAHFCRASGIEHVRPLATSAIREATNREAFVAAAKERSGLDVEVLSREREAHYGYLAAVNSTTLADGIALDIGGGSMQLTSVRDRRATQARSWRLGAVVTTERFLDADRVRPKHVKALRAHVREELEQAPWLPQTGARLTGVGGAVRNLAAAAMLAEELPSYGVQGYLLRRGYLGDLIDEVVDMTPRERRRIPGIKPERGDLILGSATVIDTVLEHVGADAIEVTQAGLREGAFFETLLAGQDEPLFADVREASVRNLAAQYHPDRPHTEHVARLALEIWDGLAAAGLHPGDPDERELLWAAAMLHDVGTAVDYDDHHKHSRYLILNAGLPGYSPREAAIIGQAARYHRKGRPAMREFEPLARRGDDALLLRASASLRLAEQLERARDQSVQHVRIGVDDGTVELALEADADVTVSRWAAARQAELFRLAFDREMEVRAKPGATARTA